MAKKAQNKKKALPMEEVLWKACDALRGSIEPSEYKHVFSLKIACRSPRRVQIHWL